ncbi:MAG: hypothetical protein H7Y31_09920 [Chitinophagaceae bacterium]|nr:hypothetical protein [Chitinophagaceae bacterium]
MLQFVIIARDGNDEQALDRRKEIRPRHLAGARILKDNNNFLFGGAMLDEDGNMRGSVMFVQFETKAEFDNWYANEPYINGNVWQEIEVQPFREAII